MSLSGLLAWKRDTGPLLKGTQQNGSYYEHILNVFVKRFQTLPKIALYFHCLILWPHPTPVTSLQAKWSGIVRHWHSTNFWASLGVYLELIDVIVISAIRMLSFAQYAAAVVDLPQRKTPTSCRNWAIEPLCRDVWKVDQIWPSMVPRLLFKIH